jgi:4-amino-4-deoxy-L-arabinose transferase-like glycosyltransferase
MHRRVSSSTLLITIIGIYTLIGTLYAAFTPTWQVPDEPAHYNYIRAIGDGQGIPVIEPGDYDQVYIRRLTTEQFPPHLPVDSLEYEDHQPPLYYLLATPIYIVFDGAVLALRLLSVIFGAGLLVVAFQTVRTVFPDSCELALMVAAFIAFIPQHVAMAAGINNDVLGELVAAGTLLALAAYLKAGGSPGEGRDRPWSIGLLLAIALLTKTTVYYVLGVAVLAIVIRWRQEHRTWKWAAKQLGWLFLPALVLSAPWFIRNGLIYGWLDPTGLARHNAVVEGQPRSAEWLAAYGWDGLLGRLVRTTFQSFWGQFGWMAVVLPTRFYQGLALLSGVLAVGFVWWLLDRRRPSLTTYQRSVLLLLFAALILTLLAYLGYNMTFVQHQGRYLFPALIPIGMAAALGLSTLTGRLPQPVRPWAMAAPFVGLAALDVYCLFRFVIPFLTG